MMHFSYCAAEHICVQLPFRWMQVHVN